MPRFGIGWISLVLACFSWGCAVSTDAPTTGTTKALPVHYQKTMCFGPCPAFTFAVDLSGKAELEVVRPLQEVPLDALAPGHYAAQLQDVNAWNARVHEALESVHYTQLDSVYDNPRVTDLPATITICYGKSVTNRYNGPDLTTLYAALDEAMAELKWHPLETK